MITKARIKKGSLEWTLLTALTTFVVLFMVRVATDFLLSARLYLPEIFLFSLSLSVSISMLLNIKTSKHEKNIYKAIPKLVAAASFIISLFTYYYSPIMVPVHWNINNQADTFMAKEIGLFLLPLTLLLVYILLVSIPKIAVYKKNFKKFSIYYDNFTLALVSFLFFVGLLTNLAALGINFRFTSIMLPVTALLLAYTFYIMRFIKRNFFIGFRTPWALSNDKVWDRTQLFGSNLFLLSSATLLLSPLNPKSGLLLFFLSLLIFIACTTFYSYIMYEKIVNKKKIKWLSIIR